jgi:flagellar biosynthesis anti-sigma factor FlgM
MRIDPKVVVPVSANEPRDAQAPRAQGTAPPASSVVTLSSAASSAQASASSAADEVSSSPEVTTKIAKIRSLLESGAYPIDLNQLASRILDDERARGGSS